MKSASAGDVPKEPVKVETLLLKLSHKKRKETGAPVISVSSHLLL